MRGRIAVAVGLVVSLLGWADPAAAGTLPYSHGFEAGQGTSGLQGVNFATGSGCTTTATSTVRAYAGTQSLSVSGSGSSDCGARVNPGSGEYNTPGLESSHTYRFEVWMWSVTGATSFSDRTMCVHSNAAPSATFACTTALSSAPRDHWTLLSLDFWSAASYSDIQIRLYTQSSAVYWDNLSITDVTGNGPTTTTGGGGTFTDTDDTDEGGIIDGIVGGLGSVFGAVGNGITGAIEAMGQFIVDGFAALFMPSQSTSDSWGSIHDGLTSKFPFSVIAELVTLPADVLSAVGNGIDAGPPADCPADLCAASGTGSLDALADLGPVQVARSVVLFVALAGFAYGVLRAIGQAIG